MSSAESAANVDAAIAMVATSTPRLPNADRILAAAGMKTAGKGGVLGSLFGRKRPSEPGPQWENGTLIVPLGDAQLAVSLMPAPIPWTELEGPCATAWGWRDAVERMQAHTNHVLVALLGGSIEPVERRIVLTKVVAAVIGDSDAVGVYWGEGTLVHEPRDFMRQARSASAEQIPGPLWIDVRVEENSDGSLRCFTTGMAPLGFLEIEVEKSSLPPDELMGFIGDTACYIVNNRLEIPDGDTMGRSETERYSVRHGKSMFDRADVMHLAMI